MASSESIDAPNSWCRVCLAVDVRIYFIRNTRLLVIYEKLSSTRLNVEDGRPHTLCYICYSQLQRCCRFSDMCHKSEQYQREHLLHGTEAEGVVPPTAITHNLDVTALPLTSINGSNQGYAEVIVKKEVPIKEEPIEIVESTYVENDTVDDNITCSRPSVKAEGIVPPTAITRNLDVTALPFTSIIDFSNQGYTEVKVKEELLIKEEIEAKEEPIDIEESTLAEDVTVNDNILNFELTPVVKTEINNVCALSLCCDVCNETFSTKKQLVQHMLIHFSKKQNACNMCNKSFTTGSNLNIHKRIHTGAKPYACNICNKSFNTDYYLSRHKKFHPEEKSFGCNICNKSFHTSTHLRRHERIHTREKPYACNICNKLFAADSSLIEHKRIHTGEKPFACNICNKSFTTSSYLITHKRIHTGEKPYGCNICNKSFHSSGDLSRHKRIHTGEKPYACNICNKSFRTSSDLNRHKRIHTAETL